MCDGPDNTLYSETVHAFLRVHRFLRRYSRRIREEGISGRKMSALRFLVDGGPRTVGQLGDYLAISDSTASEMVSQLSALGFVSRSRSTVDQRVVHVAATSAGRAFAVQAPLGGIPLLRERLRTLPRERLIAVRDAFEELAQLLEIDDGG
jgi:DNA-binding MarR family transcriptional regulator